MKLNRVLILVLNFVGFLNLAQAAEIIPGKYKLKGLECSSGAAPALLGGYKAEAGQIPYAVLVFSENSIAISSKVKRHLSEREDKYYRKEVANLSSFRQNMKRKPASAQAKMDILGAEKFIVNSRLLLTGFTQTRFVLGDYSASNEKIQLKKPILSHTKIANEKGVLVRMEPGSFNYTVRNDEIIFSIQQDPIVFSNWSMLRCPAGDRASTVYKKEI